MEERDYGGGEGAASPSLPLLSLSLSHVWKFAQTSCGDKKFLRPNIKVEKPGLDYNLDQSLPPRN
jgi:hypothetical protein